MSIDTLKQSLKSERSTGAPVGEAQLVEVPKFEKLLTLWKDEVSRALPKHLEKNMDRFLRVALTEFRLNPNLALCDPRSVFGAVLTGAQMGWEIGGVLGHAYLVPFKGECQLIPGWKGYVDLVHRSGRGEVWTGAVYEGDEFEYVLGARPDLKHMPSGEDDPKLLTHTYSIGWIKDQSHPIVEVWPQVKLERHRNRYNRVGEAHYSFQNWEMYCRKVALLQCVKYLPATPELGQALGLDYTYDTGGQQGLTVKNVTEGLVFPVGNGGDKSAAVTDVKPSEPTSEVKPEPESKVEDTKDKGVDAKVEAEAAAAKQKEIEDKAKAKAKADKEKAAKKPTEDEKKDTTPEKVVEKPSPPTSPEQKNASKAPEDAKTVETKDETPEWAKVPPKQPKEDAKTVEATAEQINQAVEQSPAPVEIVSSPSLGERKRSKYKDILGVVMPEFVTRLSNEPGPTEQQLTAAQEEMKLINGPTGEATLENTVKQWMDVDLQELTQDAMEAFINVLGKYRDSLAK